MNEVKPNLTREKVSEVISMVVNRVGGDTQAKMAAELETIAKQIDALYADLSSLNPHAIKGDHIPKAHDELMAVVEATAGATGTIMDACDKINKGLAGLTPEQSAPISDGVNTIYEACSFQDITGQRITKVVKTLRVIEEKIDGLIRALGVTAKADDAPKPEGDAALLNGPSMPGQGISQEEIDKLLGF